MKFEDYTRAERAQLIIHHPDEYMKLLEGEHLYLLLDSLAKTKGISEPEDVLHLGIAVEQSAP